MGLLRDRAFARTFGAGPQLDAYNAALVLPELTLNILVTSGLVAAFVPIYTRLARTGSEPEDGFAGTVLAVASLVMAVAIGILFLVAPATVDIVAPGFGPAERALYVELFRTMCVTGIIFAASFTLGELLVARQRFLAYAIAPILYNAGIVGGTVLLGDSRGIMGAAIGTVVGASLHLAIRILDVARAGVRIRPSLGIRSAAFADYIRLALPRMLSQPIEPLTFLYFTRAASEIVAGGVSAVSFARNFASVPVVVIGVQFAVAAFPILSQTVASGDRRRYRSVLGSTGLSIGVLSTLAAVVLAILAQQLIATLLGGGAFDAEDVAMTALLLAAFTISIPLESLVQLFARGFYATANTTIPVAAALTGLVTTVVAVEGLKGPLGIVALPIAYATGLGIRLGILLIALPFRARRIAWVTDASRPGPGGSIDE